jgi:hypothetical protein
MFDYIVLAPISHKVIPETSLSSEAKETASKWIIQPIRKLTNEPLVKREYPSFLS